MLDIRYSTRFKKDYKAIIRRGYNPQLLQDVVTILSNEQLLPPKYKDLTVFFCLTILRTEGTIPLDMAKAVTGSSRSVSRYREPPAGGRRHGKL